MKSYEVEPGPWYEGGQALHKFQWPHHDVGGTVAVRAFELQYDITGAVEFEPFIGDGGAGDVAALLLEFVALIHGAAHLGVEAEPLLVGAAFLGRLRIKAGDGLQAQHLLTRAWTECNAVGAGRQLQRCHGRIHIGFGESTPPLRSDSQDVSTTSWFSL